MALDTNQSVLIENQYVAGVTWRRIVERGAPATLALARARDEKATRYSHLGTESVVGLVKLKGVKPDTKLYSLARMVGRLHQFGPVFVAIELQERQFWICATRDGIPVAGYDEVIGENLVETRYENFVSSQSIDTNQQVSVFGSVSSGLKNIIPLGLADLVAKPDESCELKPLTKAIPRWVFFLAGAAALYFVVDFGLKEYKAYQEREKARLRALTEEDPVEGWKRVYREWYAAQSGYKGKGILDIRDKIYTLPNLVGGWTLTGGKCLPLTKEWRCALSYERSKKLTDGATNQTFEDARPKDWKILWKNAGDILEASVTFPVTMAKLTPPEVLTLQQHQLDTYSNYQTMAPAFAGINIGEFVKENIMGPVNLEGAQMDKPVMKGLEDLFRQDIGVNGPLRNVEFFAEDIFPVYWKALEFTVSNNTTQIFKTAKESRFTVVMKGITYAKNAN